MEKVRGRALQACIGFAVLLVLGSSTVAGARGLGGREVEGTGKADVLIGGPRGDVLRGHGGNDRLEGRGGNDTLYGGHGRDVLIGGPGDDRIFARDGERDVIACGPGNDSVVADALDEVAGDCENVDRPRRDANGKQSGQSGTQQPSSSGRVLRGTPRNDVLTGTPGNDRIYGEGGSDRVYGRGGNDVIDPGPGQDFVDAGPGDDTILAADGERDRIVCGPGRDRVVADRIDQLSGCEIVERVGAPREPTPPAPPAPPPPAPPPPSPSPPPPSGSVILVDRAFVCNGPVNIPLVKVTINPRASGLDAVVLGSNCSGRIGRVEVDTWSGDGIKVQNAAPVARDVVIESGYVRCHARSGGYHQDGIQVMGGTRITFRNLSVFCGGVGINAALFIARGGSGGSTPTDIAFEGGRLGPNAAHTVLLATSVRSGVRNTVICPGRAHDFEIQSSASSPINSGNTLARLTDSRCSP